MPRDMIKKFGHQQIIFVNANCLVMLIQEIDNV